MLVLGRKENSLSLKFVKEVGSLIAEKTKEKRSTCFLFQALSIALQRGNYLALTGTLGETDACLEEIFSLWFIYDTNLHFIDVM